LLRYKGHIQVWTPKTDTEAHRDMLVLQRWTHWAWICLGENQAQKRVF